MSLPNIPNITPKIDIDSEYAINLILTSVALEEISLSHILNAESEKIQHVLCMDKHKCADLSDIKEVNESAKRMIDGITRLEMLLQMKVQNILELKEKCNPCCEHSTTCAPCSNCKNCSKKKLDYPTRVSTERKFMFCSKFRGL
jgi:hypothetical protein